MMLAKRANQSFEVKYSRLPLRERMRVLLRSKSRSILKLSLALVAKRANEPDDQIA